jgi:hypothetical protein
MPKSYYLSNSVLNSALRGQSFTVPPAAYVALFTTLPTPGGGGVEVSGGDYSRQIATFTVPVNGQCVNAADVLFPVAAAPWGTVVGYGLYDSSMGGNLLYFNSLSTPRNVVVTDQIRFPASQLVGSEQ